MLFFEVQPGANEGGIARKHRVGAIIYVNVKGDSTSKGSVDRISIAPLQTVTPMNASVLVRNSGSTDFVADSTMTVKDIFGRSLYKGESKLYILPDTSRDVELQWNGSPWFGIYSIQVATTILGSTTTHTSLVLVAPVWLLFAALLVVIVGAIGGLRHVSRRSSRSKQTR